MQGEIRRHFEPHENENTSNFVECHKEETLALCIYAEKCFRSMTLGSTSKRLGNEHNLHTIFHCGYIT